MLRTDIKEFISTIDNDVTIVAATKYVGSKDMIDLYNAGITNFGENRVEPFLQKRYELMDYNVTWHFIGHLQRNKAKEVVNKIEYLHSLDSLDLAKIINKERKTPLKCFIEVSINLEESKNGVPYMELESFISKCLEYENVELVGLMMMTIKYSSDDELDSQFKRLSDLRDEMENKFNIKLPYLSMGMSDDYTHAIANGATHIRLGRILWTI